MRKPPKRYTRAFCTRCGSPTPMSFDTALGFDTEVILCSECQPKVKKPRVTLYGAPDGQEMGRWTDDESREERS